MTVRCIGRRVDHLTLPYRVEYSTSVGEAFGTAQLMARELGVEQSLEPPGSRLRLSIRPSRTSRRIAFRTAELRGAIDLEAYGRRRNLELTFAQSYLATHELHEAFDLADDVAAELGSVTEAALSRIDLCADFAGWDLRVEDHDAWLLPARAGHATFVDLAAGDDAGWASRPGVVRMWAHDRTPDGFALCQGSPISARCYDKRRELAHKRDELSTAIEHACWQAADVVDEEPISRLEIQLRGPLPRELAIVKPRVAAQALDAVWQYFTREWCSLIVPGTNERRSRCDLDPRWEVAQAVVFDHASAPRPRVRIRGAALLAQALGCVRSWQGSMGALESSPVVEVVTMDGEVLEGPKAIAARSDEDNEALVLLLVARLAEALRSYGPRVLVEEHGACKAAQQLWTGNEGTRARFGPVMTRPPRERLAAASGDRP